MKHISQSLVLSVAVLLQEAVAKTGGQLEHVAAMDQASQALGGKDWAEVREDIAARNKRIGDRLSYSNVLPAGAEITVSEPVRLLIQMSAPDNFESPNYVVIRLTQGTVNSILAARQTLLENGYRHIDMDTYAMDGVRSRVPFQELPEASFDGCFFYLQTARMRVLEGSVRFTGTPKHTSYECTSCHIDFHELKAALENKVVGHSTGSTVWVKPDVLLVENSLDGFDTETFVKDLAEFLVDVEDNGHELTVSLLPTEDEAKAIAANFK